MEVGLRGKGWLGPLGWEGGGVGWELGAFRLIWSGDWVREAGIRSEAILLRSKKKRRTLFSA